MAPEKPRIHRVNIRQLEYFLSVAANRSVTLAAQKLRVSQPTLTKTIRALEAELGVTLFERMPRGVNLTPYGQSLLRHAQAIHVQFGDAKREIDGLKGGRYGTVLIGAGPAWLRRHLPRAVGLATSKNPSVKVSVEGGYDDALMRSLRRGEIDMVIAELPPNDAARDLDLRALTSDRLCVCSREGHELARRKRLTLADLLAFPWAMPPETTRASQRLRSLFISQDLPPPNAVVQTESMAFLLQVVRFSDALTFTVTTTLKTSEASGLIMLDFPVLSAERSAGIITRKNSWLSPAAEAIVDELVKICAQEPTN
jgi:LysR family transcriptional regulator of gallate degradation